jgi:hypothetical protein
VCRTCHREKERVRHMRLALLAMAERPERSPYPSI